jgi:uncharacterized protein (DUF1778 family)
MNASNRKTLVRLSVAVPPSDQRLIRRAAFLSDRSVSAFIREASAQAAARTVQESQDPIARQTAA